MTSDFHIHLQPRLWRMGVLCGIICVFILSTQIDTFWLFMGVEMVQAIFLHRGMVLFWCVAWVFMLVAV